MYDLFSGEKVIELQLSMLIHCPTLEWFSSTTTRSKLQWKRTSKKFEKHCSSWKFVFVKSISKETLKSSFWADVQALSTAWLWSMGTREHWTEWCFPSKFFSEVCFVYKKVPLENDVWGVRATRTQTQNLDEKLFFHWRCFTNSMFLLILSNKYENEWRKNECEKIYC